MTYQQMSENGRLDIMGKLLDLTQRDTSKQTWCWEEIISIKYEQKTKGLEMPEKSRKQLRKAYRLKTYEQNF